MTSDADKQIATSEPSVEDHDMETTGGASAFHDAQDPAAGNERDTTLIPLPTHESEQIDLEKLHILLTYLSLLALCRHPSRPVIELNMETQLLQLDAFLTGNMTENGEATRWVPESETSERQQRYIDLCAQFVPNLTAAIQQQSSENFISKPKNQVRGSMNPEHEMFWRINLAPKAVKAFGEWAAESRNRDTNFNPDFDPWVDSRANKKLIDALNSIVNIQYDFTTWHHTPPQPSFNQLCRPQRLEFQRVMNDPSLIRTYYRLDTPRGKTFSQITNIPETSLIYTEDDARNMWADKSRPKYLIPDPLRVTIPRKKKGQTWTNADGLGKTWTRGDEVFTPKIFFFILDQQTNAYINYHAVDGEFIDNIDLNNEAWVTSYRKKLAQWRSRATHEVTRVLGHWRDAEKAAIYAWTNAYCKKNGIDQLLVRRVEIGKDLWNAVNSAVPGTRSVESVTAWVRRQMKAKPNSPLGRLVAEQKRVTDFLAAGSSVPDSERYPDQVIDMSLFGAQTGNGAERDDEKVEEGEDIMDDPAIYDLEGGAEDDAEMAMDVDEDNFGNTASIPSLQHPRKIKVTYKGKGKQRAESPFEYESEHE